MLGVGDDAVVATYRHRGWSSSLLQVAAAVTLLLAAADLVVTDAVLMCRHQEFYAERIWLITKLFPICQS